MKNRVFDFLIRVFMRNYMIIILIVIINLSCENETSNPSHSYDFLEYSFIGNIECYDISGNRLDSLSYMYSQNDFIYTDEFELPYDKIEINADSTVLIYYKEDNDIKTKNGFVTLDNDTLYFYLDEINDNELIFRGFIEDNQLRLPGYGNINYLFLSNGMIEIIKADLAVTLGIPNLEVLIEDFPNWQLNDQDPMVQSIYIQKFDLIYEKMIE